MLLQVEHSRYPLLLRYRPHDPERCGFHHKGCAIRANSPNTAGYAALALTAAKHSGAALGIDDGRLVGILPGRDDSRKVHLKARFSRDTLVREIMSAPVVCVRPEQSIEACMALMTSRYVRHPPVIRDDKAAGLVSSGDAVSAVIAEQECIIEQRIAPISGKRS